MPDPTEAKPNAVFVDYDSVRHTGRLSYEGAPPAVWDRLQTLVLADPDARAVTPSEIELSWNVVLGVLRDFGSSQQQTHFGFRFVLRGAARDLASRFAQDIRRARASRDQITAQFTGDTAKVKLAEAGFVKRELRDFQIRDLLHLAALPHGANFSVPGAGKTTVTFALHLLVRSTGTHLFVVCPKAAFSAWTSVVAECIDSTRPGALAQPFHILDGSDEENESVLSSGATRFVMTYDLMIRQQALLSAYFARNDVHLVLDEAHRMKAGLDSRRGAFLLNVAPFVSRRDILTGTPMPQGPNDLASQLAFLWPGQGLDIQIQRGIPPRKVLGQLYVRTTKGELRLPRASRSFVDVTMLPGQQALYGVVRSETLRRLAAAVRGGPTSVEFLGARRSVMRLLQLSVNPVLALKAIAEDFSSVNSGIIDTVLDEGPSLKMRTVVDRARQLARQGRKVVIWTIFTETIAALEKLMADLNPVVITGAVPAGQDTVVGTREWKLNRFHSDPVCMALIANPAAAGEGISLHEVCHNALYLDRSYVSTHYLQSIDRIHRLGLKPGVETTIEIFRTRAPAGLGSVDLSVGRRLAKKIRSLQELLDDPDLHEIALDEESADDAIDYAVDMQDMVDLVEELEGRRVAADEESA